MEKSIKERSNEYSPLLDGYDDCKRIYNYEFEDLVYAYIDGATDQRRIDFKKACLAFCKTRNCGLTLDTCSSLGTCEEYDSFNRELTKLLMEE